MLRGGELVGVWPEGFKGIGKPYSERYKLQRFGRGGFVSAALRTGVPDRAAVGGRRRGDLPAGRQRPLAGPAARRARTSRSRRSSRCSARSGWCRCRRSGCWSSASRSAPTSYDAGAAEDPMLVFNVTDQVRETIQQTLYSLLMQRAVRLPLTPGRHPRARDGGRSGVSGFRPRGDAGRTVSDGAVERSCPTSRHGDGLARGRAGGAARSHRRSGPGSSVVIGSSDAAGAAGARRRPWSRPADGTLPGREVRSARAWAGLGSTGSPWAAASAAWPGRGAPTPARRCGRSPRRPGRRSAGSR